jgi:hypothetical protein
MSERDREMEDEQELAREYAGEEPGIASDKESWWSEREVWEWRRDAWLAGWKAASERKDAVIEELRAHNAELIASHDDEVKTGLIWSERLAQAESKLATALECLENFAEFTQDPKDVCWPKNEYMMSAREAIARIKGDANE